MYKVVKRQGGARRLVFNTPEYSRLAKLNKLYLNTTLLFKDTRYKNDKAYQ